MSTHRPRLPGASRFGEQLYESWEKAMGAWWDQVLKSPAFLGAVGEGLAQRTQVRAGYERAMETAMDRMHLPTRKDIGRVARIATLLEERLLAQEDILLSLKDELLDARREAVQARIEAAQARLELQEELRRLHAELATLEARVRLASPSAAAASRESDGASPAADAASAAPAPPPARRRREKKP